MGRFDLRVLALESEAQVVSAMTALGVDPVGIKKMVSKAQSLNVLIEAVPCGPANIIKQEMLAIGADAAVARGSVTCSRSQTDVLLMGTRKQLHALVQRLPYQPFGLTTVAQQLHTLLAHYDVYPTYLAGRDCRLQLDRPQVMGIINVTPDSFYDGGMSCTIDDALRQAEVQVAAGADILDVGGESTRPGSLSVAAQTERDRVVPVVEAIRSRFTIPISVDTTKASVAQAALACGANFVNDISGLTFDSTMAHVVAQSGAGLFVMHTRGLPNVMQEDTQYQDLVAEVVSRLRHSTNLALDAGVLIDKISIDPGIGFGKSVGGNLEILKRLSELRGLGYPVLLGTSRKSFIGNILNQPQPEQRLNGSLATVSVAVARGVQLFRVHDVEATRQVADMAWAMTAHC